MRCSLMTGRVAVARAEDAADASRHTSDFLAAGLSPLKSRR